MLNLIGNYILIFIVAFIYSYAAHSLTFKEFSILSKKFSLFTVIAFVFAIITSKLSLSIRPIFMILTLMPLIKIFLGTRLFQSFIICSFSFLVGALSDMLAGFIFWSIHGYVSPPFPNSNFFLSLYIHGYILLVSILMIYIIRQVRNCLSKKYKLLRINNIVKEMFFNPQLFIAVNFIITVALLGINSYVVRQIEQSISYTIVAIALVLIVFFINFTVLFLHQASVKNKFKAEQQANEYTQLVMYTEVVENLLKDLRKQKHDYLNTLLSLKGYIDTNDTKELKNYFYNQILVEETLENHNNKIYQSLQHIKNPGLKGMVATKINQAISHGLAVEMAILEDIEELPMKTLDLCKIVGIFMDNAIEAAILSEEKNISLGFFHDNESINMVIGNTFKEKPEIDKIFNEGYSKKGPNRGIGLKTVNAIIKNYASKVLLNSVIENNCFIQDLVIKL